MRNTITTVYAMIAVLLSLLAIASQSPALAEEVMGVTITVDCDGVPHVRIELPAEPGLVKIAAPVDVYPGTLEASVNGRSVPVVYENSTIYAAVEQSGKLVITYVGVTELSPEGELFFKLNTAGARVVMSDCTILTSVPQNLADATSSDNGLLTLKLSGPDIVRYIPIAPATPLPTLTTPQETDTMVEQEGKPQAQGEETTPVTTGTETTPVEAGRQDYETTQAAASEAPSPTEGVPQGEAGEKARGPSAMIMVVAVAAFVVALAALLLRRKSG